METGTVTWTYLDDDAHIHPDERDVYVGDKHMALRGTGGSNHRDHGVQGGRMKFSFGMKVTTDEKTGEILAVYFQIHRGKVAITKEIIEGAVYADYDRKGNILGFEMLEPCKASILNKITPQPEARKFIKQAAPRYMFV